MIGRTFRKLIAALGLGAVVQGAVVTTGFARLIYLERRWATNPFVFGWLVQLAVLMFALLEAGRRSEREELRDVAEILKH